MTNHFGEVFNTIESQDQAYFNYIRNCVVNSGVEEMWKHDIEHLAFEYYFDSQRRINISSEIIGGVDKENVDLDGLLNYIPNCNRDVEPLYDNTNHFGDFESFVLVERTLLTPGALFHRNSELNNSCFEMFLPRNKFDYLMGFTDEFKK